MGDIDAPLHSTAQGLKAFDFNDKASSVRVPDGLIAYLHEHTKLTGQYLRVFGPAEIPDLKRNKPNGQNWGDRISSVTIAERAK